MTMDEHREDAKHLARTLEEEPSGYDINYDHEVTSLLALAIEDANPGFLTAIEEEVQGWIEGPAEKGSRAYLIEAVRSMLEKQA